MEIGPIAFLRLDGDLYASTMDVLAALYDKVIPGGFLYFDDWGSFVRPLRCGAVRSAESTPQNGCRRAIEEFRSTRSIAAEIQYIHEWPGTGVEAVWWQKSF